MTAALSHTNAENLVALFRGAVDEIAHSELIYLRDTDEKTHKAFETLSGVKAILRNERKFKLLDALSREEMATYKYVGHREATDAAAKEIS